MNVEICPAPHSGHIVPGRRPVPDDDSYHGKLLERNITMATELKKTAATAAPEESYSDTDSMELATEDGMELAVSSDRFEKLNLARDIMGGGKGFCTMTAEDKKAKITLYNACSNPDKISAVIGKKIELLHFYVEVVQVVSEQTGELVNVPRCVLIDKNGKGYQAVSIGMYNSLKRIVSMFGLPDTWDSPLAVEVQQIETKKGRTFNLLLV